MSLSQELMTAGLRALSRFAGLEALDRTGLRKPLEKAIYHGTKAGYGAISGAASPKPRATPTDSDAKRVEIDSAGRPRLFDLTPSDEQEMILETVGRFAKDVMRDPARKADDEAAMPGDVQQKFDELGMRDLIIPEAFGGYAETRSPLTNALLLESLSFGDMGMAIAMTAPISVLNLLVDFGTGPQQEYWIRQIAEEGVGAALATVEPVAIGDPWQLSTVATSRGTGFTISGEKTMVPTAAGCGFFVVSAAVPGSDPALFIVDANAPGVRIEAAPAMGLRCAELGKVAFEQVEVPLENQLGTVETGFTYSEFVARGRAAAAALATGTCKAIVDFVGPYINERHAFGEPISNRQSVSFLFADMALETDGMELLSRRAASRIEYGLDPKRSAYLAHLLAAEKGMYVGTSGVQLLGGHGFVKEYLVELWYRNLRAISTLHTGVCI